MQYTQQHSCEAFGEWLDAVQAGEASFKDSNFTLWNDEQVRIPRLLNSLANCNAGLGSMFDWLVEDYRGNLIGLKAWRTYANAVKVVRALRRQ